MAWYLDSEEFCNTWPVVPKWKYLLLNMQQDGYLLDCCPAFFDFYTVEWSVLVFLFWQPEVCHQTHLSYRVCSLKNHCAQPLAKFFLLFWSTGIHGKEGPTVQFRCKRSNSFLWLSHCRPGFREMAESSWRGSAKRGCRFWWCDINQPNVFWCAEGRGRNGIVRSCLFN